MSLIYEPVCLGDPHIHLACIYHIKAASFILFSNILTFSWEVAILSICCWKLLCFEHFEHFNLSLFLIFYIHLKCIYHARPAPILSIWQFLGGGPAYICHFLRPSVRPSIRRAPYLRNCTSYDHNFWYAYVKWWCLQVIFSFFQNFDFLSC